MIKIEKIRILEEFWKLAGSYNFIDHTQEVLFNTMKLFFGIDREKLMPAITSTKRDLEKQKLLIMTGLKASPISPHLLGLAIDFDMDVLPWDASNEEVEKKINLYGRHFGFRALSKIYNHRFVHFDLIPSIGFYLWKTRWEDKTIDKELYSLLKAIYGKWEAK